MTTTTMLPLHQWRVVNGHEVKLLGGYIRLDVDESYTKSKAYYVPVVEGMFVNDHYVKLFCDLDEQEAIQLATEVLLAS